MNRITTIRRVLVALDTSPASLAALEAAAHVAASLGAELSGLYIEDETVIRGAELPLASVVGSFSGAVRPIERREVEHQFRAQARRARHALESVAARARVRWSFRVMRGSVTASLGAACGDADLISLGRRGWTPGRRKMGRTTTTLLESEGVPLLLLDRGLRPGQAVVTVFDGSPGAATALAFARMLSRDGQTPLVVVLRGEERDIETLENAARAKLTDLGRDRAVQFYRLGTGDPAGLARLSQAGGIGILILPGLQALGKDVADLLIELRCPVLVIRKPGDGSSDL